jgi:hypothetical protein
VEEAIREAGVMLEPTRWAWRPQEGPQQALVVRLRSFAVKLSWRRPIVSIYDANEIERAVAAKSRSVLKALITAAAPHVRSRRYRNCSDNDKPDEDSSGHEIHIQALEALSACCHDCRYGQKAPSDNKRDKGFQCEHQRPALNCPKKIRG